MKHSLLLGSHKYYFNLCLELPLSRSPCIEISREEIYLEHMIDFNVIMIRDQDLTMFIPVTNRLNGPRHGGAFLAEAACSFLICPDPN